MSFFKKLFGLRSIEDDMGSVTARMDSMAAEAERVYRNLVEMYVEEFKLPAEISGRGLYKARLFATTLLVHAFILRWPGKEEHAMKLLEVAAAIALAPLTQPQGAPLLDVDEAKIFSAEYAGRIIAGVTTELRTGPSMPNGETKGFADLASLYHDALRDSIGTREYTDDVAHRLDHLVKMGIMAGLRHILEVRQNL